MYSRAQFVRKCFNPFFNFVIMLFLDVFKTPLFVHFHALHTLTS